MVWVQAQAHGLEVWLLLFRTPARMSEDSEIVIKAIRRQTRCERVATLLAQLSVAKLRW
jgi:hypothetical protein